MQDGDIIFLVVSGDIADKEFDYTNGLKAIAKVQGSPVDDGDKHFSLKADMITILPKVLTKDDFYVFPSLKDAPSIGPETKNSPNQAFRILDEDVGRDVIRAVLKITANDELENIEELKGYVGDDLNIDELALIAETTEEPATPALASGPIDLNKLVQDIKDSGLKFSDRLLIRFVASLCTKPFVILTGQTGSGKTKLAQAFAYWITGTGTGPSENRKFNVGEEIQSNRVVYEVTATDSVAVTFSQTESHTKVTLPY
ncbi:AAA family ATPase, partial [Bacteroidota bacterium]